MQDHISQLNQQQQQIMELTRKSQQLDRLTQAIQSMFEEFRDEAAASAGNDYGAQIRPDDSALVILDKLRASLRFLLGGKRQYEAQMRAGLEEKFLENQTRQQTVSDKLDAKIQENRRLKDQIVQQQLKLEEANLRLQEQEKYHNQQVQQIQRQNEQFKKENSRMQELERELKAAVKERDTLIKNRDTRLGRLAELETKLQQKEIDNITAIHAAQTANVKQIKDLTAQRNSYEKMLLGQDELKAQNQALQQQIRALRANMNVKLLAETEATLEALKQKHETLYQEYQLAKQQLLDTQSALQRLTGQHEQTAAELAQLKAENADLLRIGGKKQPTAVVAAPKAQKKQVAEIYSVQTYEAKLADKDKEVEELANRVRRLLALQHKANLSQKAFQEEKQALERQIAQQRDEIAQLRKQSTRVGSASGNAPQAGPSSATTAGEELLRDLQNMKAFGLSAAASAKSYDVRRQKTYDLDDVPDPRRPATARTAARQGYAPGSAQTGAMVGGVSVRPRIGVK